MAPGTVTKKGALVLFLRAILDLGEQAEQGNHNLGLQVLLSLEVDAFLDGSEADFTLHQFIDDVNHLSQAAPETR
jgi:hypothetical protein